MTISSQINLHLAWWLALSLTLLALGAFGQTNLMPPMPTNHVVLSSNLPPRHLVAVTNITLSWDAYTNAWFQVYSSTNGTTWQHTTNVPIWATNWTTPVDPTVPVQLFRLSAVMNTVIVTNSP